MELPYGMQCCAINIDLQYSTISYMNVVSNLHTNI